MNSSILQNPESYTTRFSVDVSKLDEARFGEIAIEKAIADIAQSIAEEWLEKHGQEAIAAIDPQAVANLVVAQAADSISQSIRKTTEKQNRNRNAQPYWLR